MNLLLLGHPTRDVASLFQSAGYQVIEVKDVVSCCRQLKADQRMTRQPPAPPAPAADDAADPKGVSAKFPVIWIGCGVEDPLDQGAKALDGELTKLGIRHIYRDREGGHVWPVWRWALGQFAPLIFHKS